MSSFEVINKNTCRIDIGTGDIVIIDKSFGPTIFMRLKITAVIESNEAYWLIERENLKHGGYDEPIKIDAQRDSDFEEDEGG